MNSSKKCFFFEIIDQAQLNQAEHEERRQKTFSANSRIKNAQDQEEVWGSEGEANAETQRNLIGKYEDDEIF